MKEINIGVIACGGRGRNAWLAHQHENGIRIIAGADINNDVLNEFSQRFPCAACFNDYRDLLAMPEIDAVFISSPVEFHERMSEDALRAGKDVYLEKPMTATIAGCDRLLHIAKTTEKKLFVGHNLRVFPFLETLKEIIDSGTIGDVKSIWCRHFVGQGRRFDDFFHHYSTPRYRFGLLLHKGSHDIDAIHWLAGAYTETIVGMGTFSAYDENGPVVPSEHPGLEQQEDHNMIIMELENGVQATYLQCHYAPDEFRNYTIIGTMGRIENIGNNYSQSTIHIWSNRKGGTEYRAIDTVEKDVLAYADKKIVNNFLDYVRFDSTPLISATDARYAVATAILGQQSIRNGCIPLSIPQVPQFFK